MRRYTSINVVSDNSNYASVDGVLLSKNNENLIQYPIGKSESNYTIPDNVTNIEAFAFYNCCNLTSVMISDSVTSIGFYSFYNCTNLTSVTIPDSVTSIEDYAFWKCSSLTGITIPDSVTRIGSAAFEGCNMLIVYSSNDVVFSYCRNYSIKCCPYIEKLSPEPYTEDVDINSTELVFYADFMCNIAYNDGFAYLFEVGIDNTPVDEIFLGEPDEGKCSIENGNRLILHFSLDKLKKGKNYYIRIEENAIKLLDQNKSFPGLAKDIWTFSIGGLFAVKEFYPEPGAENVDYNSDSPLFYINFAEKIDSNNGYAYLYEVGNNTPIETIYIGEDDDVRYGIFNEHRLVLNFSPASKRTLQQGKSYYITIDEGAIKFIDDEYNELDMHFPGIDKNVWTFSTINLDYFCFINPISEIVDERFYKDLFGPIRWENVKENGNNGSKGLCFGLNYVVGLNMIQADSIKSCLNSAEKKLSDFKTIKDLDGCKASDSQYSLLDYVKQAFIYQYTSSKNNEGRHNENQYTSLYNAIDTNLSSKPICIGILTDGEDEAVGHSLFPIEILKETDEYCDVLVYDSNGTEVSWKDCFGKTQRMHTFLHTLRLWKSKGDITGAEYDGSACTKINYVSVDSRFNLDVTKDIYNIVSSTFRLIERTPSVDLQPLFVTSGSEPVSSVNRYLYWTEAKILELNLTDTNTVSLAGVDDEIEITANAGATVRLDIENNTAKIDNIDASSEDYTITHTHAEDYDNIKSVVISGETSSTVNTESTDSGIIVSNEDNTPIEAVISILDNGEEVNTLNVTTTTNMVNVTCDENNQIEVLEDSDSDGTYETVVATTDCKSIRNAEITGIVDKQYTGSAIEQSISVAYDGTELNEGTDYTVAYENNINSGTASVIITGIGDYTGTITKTFTIEKAVQQITVSDLSLTFPGSGTISVSGNEGNLTYESDNTAIVEVDASGNLTAKGVGTASITITAEATDYYLEATKTITVTVCKSQDYLFFDKTAPTINKIVSYNGSDIRVYIEKRENASGYQIKYADNSSMTGAKTVMIKDNKTLSKVITGFKNNKTYYVKLQTYQKIGDKTYWSRWSAAKSIKITQTPYPTNVSKLSTFIGSHIKVDWTKTAGASGYHIKYADNSKMTGAKEVMVKGNSTFTKTLTGLKNGKTYYIKIQTYRTVSGKTYWSSWSPAKSIKVDQKPYGSSISKLTNPSSKAMKITWDKASSASGYHIQYATSSSLTGAKNITVNNKDTLSKTVTGLTKGKTYYVRIQTFRKVSGKTYWSSWSKAKQIKISK